MLYGIFNNFGHKMGLSPDQVRAAAGLQISLVLAIIFRYLFNHKRVSPYTRHWLSFLWGVGLLFFCFKRETFHMLFSSFIVYIVIKFSKESVVHWLTLSSSMMYLSAIHINRMYYETGYVIEISGPLMLFAIKSSYIGCSIYDGYMKNKQGKEQVMRPTLLEYLSYIFNFSSVICGPPSEYQDYCDFIEGKEFIKHKTKQNEKDPSPIIPAVSKLILGYFMIGIYGLLSAKFAPIHLGDKRWKESDLISMYMFAEMSLLLTKIKYYGAFFSGEAVNNFAGLGFREYDDNGKPCWDMLTPAHPIRLELAKSITEMVASWNILTARWLKKCIYNRISYHPTLFTWFFSALWHGFYPGYYFFFIPMCIGLYIGRKLRRRVRPYICKFTKLNLLYDILTWFLSRVLLTFYSAAFTMMDFEATLRFWRFLFYIGHLLLAAGILLVIILPEVSNSESKLKEHIELNDSSKKD